jgi:hypothetical protein
VHDETADFDGEGRTLEEVTTRGNAGFLDTRYSVENIGQEVYQPLFGCDSIAGLIDIEELSSESQQNLGSIDAVVGDVLAESGPTIAGVANVQLLYQYAQHSGMEINNFVQSLTQRPKANLIDILGFPSGVSSEEEAALLGQLSPSQLHGFMATAADTDANDTKPASEGGNDSYQVIEESIRYNRDTQDITKTESYIIDGKPVEKEVKIGTKVVVTPVKTTTKDEAASYGLKDHLEDRQEKVQAYLDTLTDRGMRG